MGVNYMENLTLEKELRGIIAWRVFQGTIKKMMEYNKIINPVDIPEFQKSYEDRITTKADLYVTRLIEENRLNEVYLNNFC